MLKFNKSSGQVSRLLLVLAVVVLVAAIIVYLVMRMAQKPPNLAPLPSASPIVLPFYEKQIGNIRFVFESALDEGTTLHSSDSLHPNSTKDLLIDNPGAKFIKVTVGAQNMGTLNTVRGAWDIDNIVDSQGREFIPAQSYVSPWLPSPDLCGAVLEPAFDPTPCTAMYKVSNQSTGLKIRIKTGQNNDNALSGGKAQTFLLDLIVK